MGNKVSSGSNFGRVILSDGRVQEIEEEALTVAELMMEHPHQVVVEFDPAATNYYGKRPSPLPADKKLESNKVYLMLPKRRGKPGSLSSEEARHLLIMANSILFTKPQLLSSTTGVLPLFARICSSYNKDGHAMIQHQEKERVTRNKLEAITHEDNLEERPEYLSRQMSGKGWKPSLDTIKEKVAKKKVSHWLL